jgi:single-strand DNA-binding protein
MNVVAIVGRVTRDPEVKTLPNGTKVAEFGVAVDKQFGKKEGEPDAFFFKVKAWGKTAEFVGSYLTKGRLVSVNGRLEQRKWEKDGEKREVIEIVAESVQGLDKPKDDAPKPAAQSQDWDPFSDE